MSFKIQGFGAIFTKRVNESVNKDLTGKGNPNGTPNGVADTKGIGDTTLKPDGQPLGKGSPNANKGEGLPDKRALDPANATGNGSPNGTPNGTKGGPKIDGEPASNSQPDAKKENDNCEFADKKGKVNESLKQAILEAFRSSMVEAASPASEISKISKQMDAISHKIEANRKKHGDTEMSGDRAAVKASTTELNKLKDEHKALVAKLKSLEAKAGK